MFSHIPTKLTVAGRLSDHRSTYAYSVHPAPYGSAHVNLHVKTHALPYVADFTAFHTWCFEGKPIVDTRHENSIFTTMADCDRGLPHPFPDALLGAQIVVISSCPNALFIAPATLEIPLSLALIVHCQCTLVNHSILGHKYDLLSIQMTPAFVGANDPAMLPCYYIDQFRVAMPSPDMLFAPFVFNETSNLDAFAIVHVAVNPNRNIAHNATSSSGLLSTAPVLPSWKANMSRATPVSSFVGSAYYYDDVVTTPLLLDLVPTFDSTPTIDFSAMPGQVKTDAMVSYRLIDAMDEMGLDGRFVAQAGLRGPDAKRVLASHMIGELLIFEMGDCVTKGALESKDTWIDCGKIPIVSIMYWILAHRAANHPLCVKDVKLRAVMHSLATRFFIPPSNNFAPSVHGSILIWSDFLTKCSVSRFMYTWLDKRACDVATLECQQVLVDTFTEVLREMLPETREMLYKKLVIYINLSSDEPEPFDFDMFVADTRFGFHRSALKLYTERLIDRTRHTMTPKERSSKNNAIMNNLRTRFDQVQRGEADEVDFPDPEDIAAQENATGGGDGETEPVHDANYYARKGAHGNGHLYLKGMSTDAPFGDGSGRMWKWASIINNHDGHSPIIIDEDPNGREGIDLRVTAYSDYRAMLAFSDFLIKMGANFYKKRDKLKSLIDHNRAKVFSGASRITLSDGATLDMSPEQMKLFDMISNDPGLLITGGAGTGKSTLIAGLLTVFNGSARRPAEQINARKVSNKEAEEEEEEEEDDDADNGDNYRDALNIKSRIVPNGDKKASNPLVEWLEESPVVLLMAYGKVASNFTRQYGMFASTVHYAGAVLNGDFHHDDRAWEPPKQSEAKAIVAIVDEITVQSLTHMTMLRNAFPNLMKLIVVGDIQQMSCIDRGTVGDAIVRIIDAYPHMKVSLTHNYRLTNQSGDDLQLEERTLRAFKAITSGSVINTPGILGPYSSIGRAADLPAICELTSWDTALIKEALTRAPILLLPHIDINLGAIASLRNTCDALVKVIGTNPSDWTNVQLLSQRRREEVGPITAHISGILFKNLPKTQQGYLPASDLCVGEKAVFKRRMGALSPNGSPCFIYTNDMRIIASIEDADETVLNAKDRARRQVVFKNQVKRNSTREYVRNGSYHARRVRLITFSDGYRVSVPYQNSMCYKDIDFLRRGLCVTNASMQGSAANTIVTYIRPEVSQTLDRRQFYTSISRMREHGIIIGSSYTLEKVCKQEPQKRNDHLHEFLARAFEMWDIMAESSAGNAQDDIMDIDTM
jgi:hypothetical protein